MGLYSEILYGGGSLYGSGGGISPITPLDLQYYRTTVEGIYVFHWIFYPAYISPTLAALDWNLELDTVPTFDSPNYLSYSKTSAHAFKNGNVTMGFEISVPSREEGITQVWYARVQTVDGLSLSLFSDAIEWTIPPLLIDTFAENLLLNTPDDNVYNQDILKLPIADRDTILYSVIYRDYATQFDKMELQILMTKLNNTIRQSLDESLYDNFGAFFKYSQPFGMANIQYRRILERMIAASLEGGTIAAIDEAVMGFTGYPPTIEKVRDTISFYCVDSTSDIDVSYLDDSGTPPILIDNNDAANGVIIHVFNPGGFTLDETAIEFLISEIVPAQTKYYVEF
jgi:hypothetical protein